MIIINVRVNRRNNQEWTIQRNGQHWEITQKDGGKKNQNPQKEKKKKNQTNNKDKLADEQHITPQIHKVNPRTRERYAAPVSYKTTTVIPIVR